MEPIPKKLAKTFPAELIDRALTVLDQIDSASKLESFYFPPSLRFEALKGKLKEYYSVRINRNWRIMFKFDGQDATEVQIIDYHD